MLVFERIKILGEPVLRVTSNECEGCLLIHRTTFSTVIEHNIEGHQSIMIDPKDNWGTMAAVLMLLNPHGSS